MELRVRPIEGAWPGPFTAPRAHSPFTGSWSSTVEILEREVKALGGDRVVLQLAVAERDCRLDGWVRADARPEHPGAIITFDSRHGPLRFATDRYQSASWKRNPIPGWQANVRAIALALEGLRKFERYGITRGGEQYTGWKQLPSGLALPEHASMPPEQAAGVFFDLVGDVTVGAGSSGPMPYWSGGDSPGSVLDEAKSGDPAGALERGYRLAAKIHHPDATGGNASRFAALEEAWRVLRGLA